MVGFVLTMVSWGMRLYGVLFLIISVSAPTGMDRLLTVAWSVLLLLGGVWFGSVGSVMMSYSANEGARHVRLPFLQELRAIIGEASCRLFGHNPALVEVIQETVQPDGTVARQGVARRVECRRCLTPIGD